jgi:hypothetical protein
MPTVLSSSFSLCRKRRLCSHLSLCLSRAYLGKPIVVGACIWDSYGMLTKWRVSYRFVLFRTLLLRYRYWVRHLVRERT